MKDLAIVVGFNAFMLWICWRQLRWYNREMRQNDLMFGALARECLRTGEQIYEYKYRTSPDRDPDWQQYATERLDNPGLHFSDWERERKRKAIG